MNLLSPGKGGEGEAEGSFKTWNDYSLTHSCRLPRWDLREHSPRSRAKDNCRGAACYAQKRERVQSRAKSAMNETMANLTKKTEACILLRFQGCSGS